MSFVRSLRTKPTTMEMKPRTSTSGDVEESFRQMKTRKSCGTRCIIGFLIVVVVLLAVCTTIAVIRPSALTRFTSMSGLSSDKSFLGIGLRNDERIQDCVTSHMKQTFPDVDYAMLGYNILKGYPIAIGHDPGFSHRLFRADYSRHEQTSDCQYTIPHGYTIIPDVSCITSFSSQEVKTSFEFSNSLSAQAQVSGGGWGVSFSASAGYNSLQSELSSQQSIFVLSKASCNYYYASLNTADMPEFDETFLDWAERLAVKNEVDDDVMRFIDYYGTHFLTEVKFGAKFIYQHKMSTSSFQELSQSGYSVGVQASYSGAFSLGGGFSLSSSQQSAASSFSQKVETQTITVGAAPPANGDALTWASTVKNTPVPTEYSLSSIVDLFTPPIYVQVKL